MKKVPPFLRMPIDCLGLVIGYMNKFSDIIILMRVCKKVNEAIQSPLFVGSRIIFVIEKGKNPIEGVVANFVRRVKIVDSFIEDELAKGVFRMFPNLEDVCIHDSRFISDKTIQELHCVRILDVSSCRSLDINCLRKFSCLRQLTISRKNMSSFKLFNVLRNITVLKLTHDPSIILTPLHVTKDLMENFPGVIEFHGQQCQLGEGEVFFHQKKLRFLDLTACHRNTRSDITDIHIKNLVNLQTLIINYIQFSKINFNRKENEIVLFCGDLLPEAFKNLYTVERLEIKGNFRLDPVLLSFLPKLRILSAKGCSKEMIEEALRICHRFDKIEICECLPHKPPPNPNDRYFEVKDPINKDNWNKKRTQYRCKKCSYCELCRDDIDFSNSFRCDECHLLICKKKSCRAGGMCEHCSGQFCRKCRQAKFFFGQICSCEWDWLCSKCIEQFFFNCDLCDNTICSKCAVYCKDCKKKVCWNCKPLGICSTCEGEIEECENTCKECFDYIECGCLRGMKERERLYFSMFSRRTLCEECAYTCPLCEKVMCNRCFGSCDICEKSGCLECINDGEELYSSCDRCGSFCQDCGEKTKFFWCKEEEGGCGGVIGCDRCKSEEEIEEDMGGLCNYCMKKKEKEERN